MQQSVIGPGVGVFSRHAKVLEDDDSSMTVRTALAWYVVCGDRVEVKQMAGDHARMRPAHQLEQRSLALLDWPAGANPCRQ
jgi:hypothetical protein